MDSTLYRAQGWFSLLPFFPGFHLEKDSPHPEGSYREPDTREPELVRGWSQNSASYERDLYLSPAETDVLKHYAGNSGERNSAV